MKKSIITHGGHQPFRFPGMVRNIFTLSFLIIFEISNLSAQTFLEKSAARLNISVKIPSQYQASVNEGPIFPAEITETNPIPKIAQYYRQEPAKGGIYFNVLLGMVTSILKNSNNECMVLVFIPPGRGGSSYGRIAEDSTMLRVFKNISFSRIKHEFDYESPFNDASELAAMELYSMLTKYTEKEAKEKFNAGAMVSYPLNFKKNVFQEKYTRGRAVVIGNDRREVYLYFMLTNQSVLDFDKYLEEFNRAFVFN